MIRKWGNTAFMIIVSILVVVTTISQIRHQPTVAVAVRSWSMTPLITRGDIVFIKPVTQNSSFSEGQIIVFRSIENGINDWTLHRIVGGSDKDGFVTQGDANEETDQLGNRFPLIQPAWIAGVVPMIGKTPLKIPLVGRLSLYMQENTKNPKLFPIFLGVLFGVLVLDEVLKSPKRRKKEVLAKGQLYILGGFVFSFLIGTLMLASSLFITLPYGVDDHSAVLMGSSIGILQKGESRELKLAELTNKGPIPSFYFAVSNDKHVILQQNEFRLQHGGSTTIKATLIAEQLGMQTVTIQICMFLPFLPTTFIAFLARINIWLAFIIVSLTPALPLFLLPWLDPRIRRDLGRKWRKRFSTIQLP